MILFSILYLAFQTLLSCPIVAIETQGKYYEKSKTGVSVVLQKLLLNTYETIQQFNSNYVGGNGDIIFR